MTNLRPLPYNEDCEKGLLCSIRYQPDILLGIHDVLRADVFYNPAHGLILEVLVAITQRSSLVVAGIDFFAVKNHLRASGKLEEAGGVELLNEIWNFVPTGSNWRYYLEGVVHHYRRRIAIIESLRLIEQMYDLQSPLEETIRETVERVFTKLAIQGSRAEKMLKDRAHGTTGSSLRHEETRKAAVGLPAAMFVKPISLPALIHVLEGKVNKGWSQKDFPDMRLVIAASVPQVGATASTFLFEARLNVNEMNAQLSPILEQTKYSAAYLYVMMPESVYEWKKESGWKKLF
jgi:DnaB-like helicase N terminal domain